MLPANAAATARCGKAALHHLEVHQRVYLINQPNFKVKALTRVGTAWHLGVLPIFDISPPKLPSPLKNGFAVYPLDAELIKPIWISPISPTK